MKAPATSMNPEIVRDRFRATIVFLSVTVLLLEIPPPLPAVKLLLTTVQLVREHSPKIPPPPDAELGPRREFPETVQFCRLDDVLLLRTKPPPKVMFPEAALPATVSRVKRRG